MVLVIMDLRWDTSAKTVEFPISRAELNESQIRQQVETGNVLNLIKKSWIIHLLKRKKNYQMTVNF
jgi:hypothetical protein